MSWLWMLQSVCVPEQVWVWCVCVCVCVNCVTREKVYVVDAVSDHRNLVDLGFTAAFDCHSDLVDHCKRGVVGDLSKHAVPSVGIVKVGV